jgi:hypothetical protein
MKNTKLPLPDRWNAHRNALGFIDWKHQDEPGEMIYDRQFCDEHEFDAFLSDRWGARFARKVIASVNL